MERSYKGLKGLMRRAAKEATSKQLGHAAKQDKQDKNKQ
jgi:hypothetical protein